jgi:glucose/arabinose dehydrogenase
MISRHIAVATALFLVVAPGIAAAQSFPSSAGDVTVETVAGGLSHPWALAFLPDGRMLVTERPGRLRVVTRDGKLSPPVAGVPKVFASGQGGLLDVIVDRNYAQNQTIYFCYAEPADGGGRTAMARARLIVEGAPRLEGMQPIFHQAGPLSSGNHFGCRIVQMPDSNLFLTTGEHFSQREEAQKLDNHLGKLIRIRPDGSAPSDNPFVGKAGARPEIWSYGHRNMQGLALNPATGKVWEQEHGPRGGDEINIPQPGKNYGWPLVSFGVNYDGTPVGNGKSEGPGIEQPIWHWTPSIAPSGMAFYAGDLFPAWKGHLFNGALAGKFLVRLELDGDKVVKEERFLQNLGERIRDVRNGPDGAIWLVTDNAAGRILRVTPAK